MRIVALLFLAFLLPPITHAQYEAGAFTDPAVELQSEPMHPAPNETVRLTLTNYRSSDFGAEIDWYVDDELIEEAHNQRTATVVAGNVGTSKTVTVLITAPRGSKNTVTTTIKPVYLDIIVEPQTRVPDFYQGRSLPSIGSQVNLTALLNNGSMMGTDYVYMWWVNDTVLEGGPIRGRNKVSFATPQGSEIIITLQVSQSNGSVVAKRALIIPSVSPVLHFYEVNTLYGTGYRSLARGLSLIGNSTTIKAEPYYLDSRIFNSPDLVEWSINSQKAPSYDPNPYEITLERTGFSGGFATVGFHVRSTDVILQGARGNMQLNF